jgi:hypothetical protein
MPQRQRRGTPPRSVPRVIAVVPCKEGAPDGHRSTVNRPLAEANPSQVWRFPAQHQPTFGALRLAAPSRPVPLLMAGSIDDVDRGLAVVAAREDRDVWSRDRGPRYDGSPIRVGLPPADELEFFGGREGPRRRRRSRYRRPSLNLRESAYAAW